jgi:hypothetical protein
MPEVARQSEATRPKQQNSAIVRTGWVSVRVTGIVCVRTFEIAFIATSIDSIGIQSTAGLVTGVGFRNAFRGRENGFKGVGGLFCG